MGQTDTPVLHQMTDRKRISHLTPTWGSYSSFVRCLSLASLSPSISEEEYDNLYRTDVNVLRKIKRVAPPIPAPKAAPRRQAPIPLPRTFHNTPPTKADAEVQTEVNLLNFHTPSSILDWDVDNEEDPIEAIPPQPEPESDNQGNEESGMETTPPSIPRSVEDFVEESIANTIGEHREKLDTVKDLNEQIEKYSAERELVEVENADAIKAANHLWTKTRGRIVDVTYYTYCASIINEYLDQVKIKDPVSRRMIMNEAIILHRESLTKGGHNPFVNSFKTVRQVNRVNRTNLGIRKKNFVSLFGYSLFSFRRRLKTKQEYLNEY